VRETCNSGYDKQANNTYQFCSPVLPHKILSSLPSLVSPKNSRETSYHHYYCKRDESDNPLLFRTKKLLKILFRVSYPGEKMGTRVSDHRMKTMGRVALSPWAAGPRRSGVASVCRLASTSKTYPIGFGRWCAGAHRTVAHGAHRFC
jgi:hypothetical protein